MNEAVKVIIGALLVVMFVVLLLAAPTYLLWNWLMPELFGLTTITFWQALGINCLAAILFKPYTASGRSD